MKTNKFFFQLDKLRDVPRFSTYPLYKENVAEHSYYVTLFAMFIARHLACSGEVVDVGKAMSFAVMHDAEESFLGDVLLGTKQKMATPYDEAAKDVVYKWLTDCIKRADERGSMFWLWRWAKHDTTEGRVVRYSDALAALLVLMRQHSVAAKDLAKHIYDDLVANLTLQEANNRLHSFTAGVARSIYYGDHA